MTIQAHVTPARVHAAVLGGGFGGLAAALALDAASASHARSTEARFSP